MSRIARRLLIVGILTLSSSHAFGALSAVNFSTAAHLNQMLESGAYAQVLAVAVRQCANSEVKLGDAQPILEKMGVSQPDGQVARAFCTIVNDSVRSTVSLISADSVAQPTARPILPPGEPLADFKTRQLDKLFGNP